MAASLRDTRSNVIASERKPVLIDKIDGIENDILGCVLLPKEDGFISIGDDKYLVFSSFFLHLNFQSSANVDPNRFQRTIRIWLKRETGKFWPSVCFYAECK